MSAEVPTVVLVSCDNERFEVPKDAAEQSVTILNILNEVEGDGDSTIPLPNVEAKVLGSVVEYLKFLVGKETKHNGVQETKEEFNRKFVNVDKADLFKLVLAANYLNISTMLDVTCQAVADLIKGKAPDDIRKEFGLENDFTPDEEAEIRRENQWAFD